MPKRPNPSPDSNGKDETKKARGGDDAAGVEAKRSVPVPLNANAGTTGPPLAAVASSSTAAAAGRRPIRGMPPSASSTPKSQTKTTTSSKKSSSSNGISGAGNGNSFLKSLRSKTSATTNNGNDAKKKSTTAEDAATAPMKKESNAESVANNNNNNSNSSATISSVDHPIVPFPHLPFERNEWLKTILLPLMVFLLFLLNMAAVTYIASEQSRQSVIALQRNFELNKLTEELAASTDEVNILRGRVHEMEKAREGKGRMALADDDEEMVSGLFGPMVVEGGGNNDDYLVLTREERNEWLEKLRILEADGRDAMDEFHKKLVEFGGVDGVN